MSELERLQAGKTELNPLNPKPRSFWTSVQEIDDKPISVAVDGPEALLQLGEVGNFGHVLN